MSQYVGHLNNRFGPRVVMSAGMACMGAGALALAFIGEATLLVIVEFELFVVGIGLGLNTAPVNGVAVLGALFAAYAGQQAAAGANFMPGLRAAMIGGGVSEFLGMVVAFAFIRHDSLKAKAG